MQGEPECGQDMALYCTMRKNRIVIWTCLMHKGWIEPLKRVRVFSPGRTPESLPGALFHDDAFFEDEDVPLADLDRHPLSAHRPFCENIMISSADL